MANIPETVAAVDEFDAWVQGIYQLEQEDLVLGGADGIDNLQAKQLLARSNWLKMQVLGLGAGKQPLDDMLTALSALVTAADQTLYFTGPDAPALTALTAFARTLLAAADAADARATIGAASPADVAAAIAALVDSSPGTLDTLNELAAALGDDANFAATVTNALALKAALASPAFTGNPTAPTQAQFDSSTKLATTEFVEKEAQKFAGQVSYAASAALTDADFGKLISVSGSGTVITLPAVSASNGKHVLTFFNGGSADVTIQRAGANVFYPDGGTTQIVLGQYDTLSIESNGVNGWMVVSGSAQLKRAGVFANSLNGAGYQKLPGGLILQWGAYSFVSSNSASVTFPITFPNVVLQFGTFLPNVTTLVTTVSATTSGMTLAGSVSGSYSGTYFAIGR
ncbi:MAG: hypothetical protein ROZ00_04975 [Denitratisoma sp.]|nr:hypothetical protein [Denitratisoma sp.]